MVQAQASKTISPTQSAEQRRELRRRLREAVACEVVTPVSWDGLGAILRLDDAQQTPPAPAMLRRAGLSRKFIREETPLVAQDDLLECVTHWADMATILPEQIIKLQPVVARRVDSGVGDIPAPPSAKKLDEAAASDTEKTEEAPAIAAPPVLPFPAQPPRRFVEARYRELRNEILSHVRPQDSLCIGLIDVDDDASTIQLYAGLAAALCDKDGQESPVLLLDASLVDRRLSRSFGSGNLPGLGEYVLDDSALDELIVPTSLHGISLLPCGSKRPRELRDVTAESWDKLFTELKSRFPYILVEFSAESALTGTLASHLNTMQICFRLNRTPRIRVTQLVRRLEREGIPHLGCLLADLPRAA